MADVGPRRLPVRLDERQLPRSALLLGRTAGGRDRDPDQADGDRRAQEGVKEAPQCDRDSHSRRY
jgi:hypothetical protein